MEEQLHAFYDQFVEKAAESRHTKPEQIDALAQGRVWTGRQAKANGLVDELGGLDRAIAVAKQRAKIPVESEVELVVYPPRKSFYELLSEQFSGSGDQMAVGAWMSANLTPRRAGGDSNAARAAGDVPPRRAARADAVDVPALIRGLDSASASRVPHGEPPRGARDPVGPRSAYAQLTTRCSVSRLTSIFIFCFAFTM